MVLLENNLHSSTLPLKRSFDDMNSYSSSNHMDLDDNDDGTFNPRRYQIELFEVAKQRNTIAVLKTGSGKTMIAVMLIKEIGELIKRSGDKKLILFLAPTVHLVHQQFEVIKAQTDLQAEEYFGAKGVDVWNAKSWEEEIRKHQVLVMTPQILLDALRKAFLSLEMVSLMVLDECHRASGNHPYSKIMKEFYHRSSIKPKIFGMTASPVMRKGVSSAKDCESQLFELESIMDSKIYTIEDRRELEVFVPSAQAINKFYDPAVFSNTDLKEKLEASWSKYDALLIELQRSLPNHYVDMDDKFKLLRKRLSTNHAKILYCLDDLGLLCAYEAVKICKEKASCTMEAFDVYKDCSIQFNHYLEEILCIIGSSLPSNLISGSEVLLDVGWEAVEMGYLTPKIYELIQIFQSFGVDGEVLCLIFVDRIIAARVIERLMKRITCLSHFAFSYVTGSNSSANALTPKEQIQTLESFRSGKVNLLFATDVVEEGIHVPDCSCVIRFDLPKTVRSFVQSRGRARQSDSQFVMMIERGNIKQRNQLFDIMKSEQSMKDTSINRDTAPCIQRAYNLDETNAYFVEATGASVTPDSSVSLIHRYCEKLPGDKYFTPKPIFQLSELDGPSYQCKLTLPPNAAFQTLDGPVSRSSHLSKQLVCLEACKKLHNMGALDDHLLPSVEKPSEDDVIMKQKESNSGAGTTKRKELHGTVCIRSLSGTWGDKLDGVSFEAYKFNFSSTVVGKVYSGFVLLVESKLDDEVGNAEIDLFMQSNEVVKTSISSCGQVKLDAEQIGKAKGFQELFFNGLFGKLFVGPRSSKEFLLQSDTKSLWIPSNMYLLLPIDSSDTLHDNTFRVNWMAVTSCVNVVEFLKKNHHHLRIEDPSGAASPCHRTDQDATECQSNTIHFANKSVCRESLKGMVVLAAHSGRIYCVLDVLTDTTADSPFDGNENPSDKTTFANYFKKSYKIELLYPGQPLLLLKQSHIPHNLLTNFAEEGISRKKKTSKCNNKEVPDKPRFHVRMPAELLISTDVPESVLKSFYLLPSVMYRLESLMLACQLREEIDPRTNMSRTPSSLILQALTTLKCCESFSMERLELLGDSVLKYAVGCHLFLKHPDKHEGKLSDRRSWAVCNATLHKLGTNLKLQGYIRDGAFEPRRWIAPGHQSIHLVPCTCGLDTLEVPLESKFQTEDPKKYLAKVCDRGHRWIVSKSIADCLEALIGAYYVGGGLIAALHLMKWFGIDAEIEPSLVIEAINTASLRSYIPKINEIQLLESKLGYEFSVKGLLLEAITHASEHEVGASYCYQRLEYLGDSVLDLIITRHLYQNYTDIDQGELTDLRSASVNNENFAQTAVRHNLQLHLQHSSGILQSQIEEYVKRCSEDTGELLQAIKGPKALGDLVESIAGAILVDTQLNIDEVWRVYEPLLSPIVTPDKLELPPLRELIELCDCLGYFIKEKCETEGEVVQAELTVQLKDVLLVGKGCGKNKKEAKGQAALQLLKKLEKRKKGTGSLDLERCDDTAPLRSCSQSNADNSLGKIKLKKQKTCNLEESGPEQPAIDSKDKASSTNNLETPVLASINMKKGGPRTSLYELCKITQWPMPTFETAQEESKTAIIFEGQEKRQGFISFVSKIRLHIPDHGEIVVSGEARADKKSSFDSAAVAMLQELQRQGKLVIGDP